ncbi:PREDICTED: uncharacterized protein LOC18612711 [Theobroma cacao]|uniref:Uncharacterized protein LOC18612711 n=1 Tax=Theobroma cacao TaxID=3641 RepID=A0AB32W565_THECC|nr:PREDICTED: uncharacterized protein LOC18612711 [Theobroma cacao]
MRVFKWSPDFEGEKESAMISVWISFSNLKAHLYEKSALLLIAKIVGKPLYVDEATANGSRPSVARVCIEYDCRQPLVEEVWIVIRNRETGAVTGGYSQRVDFSRLSDYCNHCFHVGHKESECLVLGNRSSNKKSSEKNATDSIKQLNGMFGHVDHKTIEERLKGTEGRATVIGEKRKNLGDEVPAKQSQRW